MNLPHVVQYLRSGKTLEALEQEHGVVSRHRNGKVSLSYHQIDSRRSDPLACQCRGLILRNEGTGMEPWQVIAYPPDRFFGYDEPCAAQIDWGTARTEEKMDGTMIIAYHDLGIWYAGTRKDPEAATVSQAGLTYRQMVDATVKQMVDATFDQFMNGFALGKGYTYTFELTAPENQVVCEYKERQLWLLAIRDLETMREVNPEPTFRPPTYSFSSLVDGNQGGNTSQLNELVQKRSATDHEGFVVVDENFNRIKIKSDEYRKRSHLLDADKTYAWQWRMHAPWTSLVEAVCTGKVDRIAKVASDGVRRQIDVVNRELDALCAEAEMVSKVVEPIDDMKLFAKVAKGYRWPSVLFALKRGVVKTAREHAEHIVPRNMVRLLGLDGKLM